jgi:hypothetical protein
MPAHSRSKNGVTTLAYVAGIHVLIGRKDVDGRNKSGHDAPKQTYLLLPYTAFGSNTRASRNSSFAARMLPSAMPSGTAR